MKMDDKERLSEIKKQLAEIENAIKKSDQKAEVFDLEVEKQVLLDEIQELEEKTQSDEQQENQSLKYWKKANEEIIVEFEQEGDKLLTAWDNNGLILFITKPKLPDQREYIIGEKGLSQMDSPRLLSKAKDEKEALKFAREYMQKHDFLAGVANN